MSKTPKRSAWFSFIRWCARNLFFRPFGGIKTFGAENIPLDGPILIAPNHVSHLDPPICACAQNRRQLTFMAKEELFSSKAFGWLIRSLGAFPIRRGESDMESIRNAIGLLEEGRAMLVFPEGARGDGKTLGKFNAGPAMLAKRTGAKVVPVGIVGTHLAWPSGKSKPMRHPMTVAFGIPFTYEEVASGANEKENRELFNSRLAQNIQDLCKENGLDLKISSETKLQSAVSNQ